MNYIYIGKIVNTHGIKGEIRIISDVKNKDKIFKINNNVYIGNKKEKEIINSYRIHKNYDMITLKDINNINEVLKYKGLNVYVNKEDFKDLIFDEDYIGMKVYTDKYIGEVTDILKGKIDILEIRNNDKKYLVPNINEFVKKIDFETKTLEINNIKGLIDED